MSEFTEALRIEMELRDKQFKKELSQSMQVIQKMGDTADRFGNKMEKAFSRSAVAARGLNDALTTIYRSTQAFKTYVAGPVEDFLKTSGEFEKMNQLLKGLSHSTDEIGKSLDAASDKDFIIRMAKNAPFEIKALQDAFVKFRVAGLDPTNGSLKALVDSVASFGGSSDEMHRAAIAIQQMYGKGAISMEELRQQLGEAVPDAMKALAEVMTGGDMRAMVDRVSTGKESAAKWVPQMLEKLGEWHKDAAKNMMGTWSGMVSRMKTEYDLFKDEIMKSGPMDDFKEIVSDITKRLSDKSTIETTKGLASNIGSVAKVLGVALSTAFEFKDTIIEIGKVLLAAKGFSLLGSGVGAIGEYGKGGAVRNMVDSAFSYAGNWLSMEGGEGQRPKFITDELQRRKDTNVAEKEALVEKAKQNAIQKQEEYAFAQDLVRINQEKYDALQQSITVGSEKVLNAEKSRLSAREAMIYRTQQWLQVELVNERKAIADRLNLAEQGYINDKARLTKEEQVLKSEVEALHNSYYEKAQAIVEGERMLEELKTKKAGLQATAASGQLTPVGEQMNAQQIAQVEQQIAAQEKLITSMEEERIKLQELYMQRQELLTLKREEMTVTDENIIREREQFNESSAALTQETARRRQLLITLESQAQAIREVVVALESGNTEAVKAALANLELARTAQSAALAELEKARAAQEDAVAQAEAAIATDIHTQKMTLSEIATLALTAATEMLDKALLKLQKGGADLVKGMVTMAIQFAAMEAAMWAAGKAAGWLRQQYEMLNQVQKQVIADMQAIANGSLNVEGAENIVKRKKWYADGGKKHNANLDEDLANAGGDSAAGLIALSVAGGGYIDEDNVKQFNENLSNLPKVAYSNMKRIENSLNSRVESGEISREYANKALAQNEEYKRWGNIVKDSGKTLDEIGREIESNKKKEDSAAKKGTASSGSGDKNKDKGKSKKGKGGGGFQKDTYSDFIQSISSEAAKLAAENENLINGVNDYAAIEERAKAIVNGKRSNGKNGKKAWTDDQFDKAVELQVALLKQQDANKLLKTSSDDLAKSQEELSLVGIEVGDNYINMSSAMQTLEKRYATQERLLPSLNEKRREYYETTKNQVYVNTLLAESLKMKAKYSKKLKDTEREYINDSAVQRERALSDAVGQVNAEYQNAIAEMVKRKATDQEIAEARIGWEMKIRQVTLDTIKANASAIDKLRNNWANATGQMEGLAANWSQSFSDNIVEAMNGGEVSWRDFLRSMLVDMQKVLVQKAFGGLITNMFESISQPFGQLFQFLGDTNPLGTTGMAMPEVKITSGQVFVNGSPVSSFQDPVKDSASQAQQMATDTAKKAAEASKEVKNGMDGLAKTTEATDEVQKTFGQQLIDTGKGIWEGFTGIIGKLGTAVGEFVSWMGRMIGQGITTVGGWFGFANGGIMTSKGALPLKAYAGGGIANSPQLALFGEGAKPEAFVPLPDGRSIPVTLTGNKNMGGNYTPVSIQINVDNNGAGSQTTSGGSGNDSQNQMWSELAQRIKGMVVEEINTQKRPGGVLY